MEIGENDENIKTKKITTGVSSPSVSSLHATQSQPIIFGAIEDDDDNQEGAQSKTKENQEGRKRSGNRRVSFAASSQLTQYLEPINPFESFGELITICNV